MVILAEEESTELLNATFRMLRWAWNGILILPLTTQASVKADLFIKENGKMFPDDFGHEHSLVFDTEKGLVVFNSCSHGGVDNIITEILATFPEKEICAYIGGLHLYKSTGADVRALAKRTKETGITRIITGHCTGDEAFAVLKEELGDIVEQMYTGMEIEL